MMNVKGLRTSFAAVAALGILAGCANYRWTPTAPEKMRTIAVPTFRNESKVTELGNVMTRQVLREIQREGTFSIRPVDEAAVEIQGLVKSAQSPSTGYDRRTGIRTASFAFSANVEVSIVDKVNGRVLVNNRPYRAETTFVAREDITTAQRDASGRLAEDLARQVVDDLVNLNWNPKAQKESEK